MMTFILWKEWKESVHVIYYYFLCHLFLTAYSIELKSFVLWFSIKQERGCNGISKGFKNRATWQNPILLLNNLIVLYTA